MRAWEHSMRDHLSGLNGKERFFVVIREMAILDYIADTWCWTKICRTRARLRPSRTETRSATSTTSTTSWRIPMSSFRSSVPASPNGSCSNDRSHSKSSRVYRSSVQSSSTTDSSSDSVRAVRWLQGRRRGQDQRSWLPRRRYHLPLPGSLSVF